VIDYTGDRGHAGPRSSPAVAGGKVVTLGAGGTLSCLDANSGKVVWRKDSRKDYSLSYPTFHVASSPLIVDGICIVQLGGQGKGGVFAFDLDSGNSKWTWDAEAPSYASPVLMTVDGVKMVVAVAERSIVGLDVASGKVLWQSPVPAAGPMGARRGPGGPGGGPGGPGARPGGGPGARGGRGGGMSPMNTATPIVDGQNIIVAINGHKALSIEKAGDAFAAKDLWTNPDVSAAFCTPVVHDDLIFGISNRGNLYCLDKKTGAPKWTGQDSLGRMGFGSIVDAGAVLAALTPAGELRIFKPSDQQYSQIAKIKVTDTEIYASPVFAGNRLLIKDKDSLMAYAVE
jgi:outer membrane protein assembly factor BamB